MRWNGTGTPPAALVDEAARHPGGHVYEIDSDLIGDPNGYVPPEAIRGGWKVDARGRLTGTFVRNENYGPPRDDFSKLYDQNHWLGWLGDDPAGRIRDAIAEVLSEQVAGAQVRWMKILDPPRYLTSGRRRDTNELIVTRTGTAVRFALGVSAPGRNLEVLWGAFTIAATGIDTPDKRTQRVWLDLHADLEWAEAQLQARLTQVSLD